ncbi:MAG: Xaa-Pro dipeptidase [Alphaproteobacteria bacterium RIFCSPHIGHO2_12_FULL_63_12]|nr:MAG: Xaa-Pro dipeptidase [Alphaproteobacteria bacterium RIFCSPHIGHO2_12_FULL_63_12]
MRIAASILFAIAATPALAAPTYVTAARMIDPASGKMIVDPAVVVDEGKVVAVGTRATLPAPDGATTVDLGAKTILPGLIDMHTHLIGDQTLGGYRGIGETRESAAIWSVVNAEKTLMAGFTTVRNVGAGDYADVALRDAIAAGVVPGPRMYVSGPSIGIVGGHCSDYNLLPNDFHLRGEGAATGPWEMREKVRNNIKYGADVIKTCSTGGVFSKGTVPGAEQNTIEEMQAIVAEAHQRGLKVASHAHGNAGIKNAIKAGVDTIEHASYLDKEAVNMAKSKGVYLVMDIYNTEYTQTEGRKNGVLEESLRKDAEIAEIQRESFRLAAKMGAKLAYGTDSGVYPHGDNGRQFAWMVKYGMTPIEAVRSATTYAAQALGKEKSLGQIRPGYAADIIAVDGDPLTDVSVLEKVGFVMKDGAVYKND